MKVGTAISVTIVRTAISFFMMLLQGGPSLVGLRNGAVDGLPLSATLWCINFRRAQPVLFLTSCRGFDCSQGYHRRWLPDSPSWKTQQWAERRGEPTCGFGRCRLARYRFEEGRSGDRTVHSPSPPQRSQPKCPRLRYRLERASSFAPLANKCARRQRPYEANISVN